MLFSNGDGTWRSARASAPPWANQQGAIARSASVADKCPAAAVLVQSGRQSSGGDPGHRSNSSGTIWTYGATLIDPATGNPIGSEQQFNSLNLAADIKEMQAEAPGMQFNMNQNGMLKDPDPDPGQAAPAIADIYKIELVRNPQNGVL